MLIGVRWVAVICALSFAAGPPGYAQNSQPDWIAAQGKACLLWNPHPLPKETVTWSGECPEVLAEGQGTAQWVRDGVPGIRVEGTYRKGHLVAGVVSYPNGDRFQGELRDAEPAGQGVYSFANGNRYVGQFRSGRRNGQGVFTWANGDAYSGEFRDDSPWGRGVFKFKNGVQQEGTWERNQLVSTTGPAPTEGTSRREIALVRKGGMLAASVTINGSVTLPFVIDSGASVVTISTEALEALIAAKAITSADMRGSHKVRLADGSEHVQPVFLIRSLKLGNLTIPDVIGSVSKKGAPLLLGQNVLGRFRSWSVDNSRQVLVLQ